MQRIKIPGRTAGSKESPSAPPAINAAIGMELEISRDNFFFYSKLGFLSKQQRASTSGALFWPLAMSRNKWSPFL